MVSSCKSVAILVAALSLVAVSASAATYSVVYSFGALKTGDGQGPQSSLIQASDGNLWGTTTSGGAYAVPFGSASGTIYSLNPTTGTETVRYSYKSDANPLSGLLQSNLGGLWGTTNGDGRYQSGTVFRISPRSGGPVTLHTFGNSSNSDGIMPSGNLIRDKKGFLWGTTEGGGANSSTACAELLYNRTLGTAGCGTVFKLLGLGGGGYRIVHNFSANSTDGFVPFAGLMQDTNGNFWGTTAAGGGGSCTWGQSTIIGCGTVFEITANGTYSVVHAFANDGVDGANSAAPLIQDTNGNIWGTTQSGGAFGAGTVFKIATNGTYSIVYSFAGSSTDGFFPSTGLMQDTNGDIWGTTSVGGTGGYGTVFEIARDGTYSVVHNFDDGSTTFADGDNPEAGLMQDTNGNIWGTTYGGGTGGNGTVFEITP